MRGAAKVARSRAARRRRLALVPRCEAELARMWRGGGGSLSRPMAVSLLARGAAEVARRARSPAHARWRGALLTRGGGGLLAHLEGGLLAAWRRRACRGALLTVRQRLPARAPRRRPARSAAEASSARSPSRGSRATRWRRWSLARTVEDLGHGGLAWPTLLMKHVRFLSVSFNLVSWCWKCCLLVL